MKSECSGTFCEGFKSGSSLLFKCPIPQCFKNKGVSYKQEKIVNTNCSQIADMMMESFNVLVQGDLKEWIW